MSATTLDVNLLKNEALRVIWQEVQQAIKAGRKGVIFEAGRPEIWIFYSYDKGSCSGQNQRYPNSLWQDICLAMRLIGRLAHRLQWPDLVNLSEGLGSNLTRWSIYFHAEYGDPLPALYRFLQRVDEAIEVLDRPLE